MVEASPSDGHCPGRCGGNWNAEAKQIRNHDLSPQVLAASFCQFVFKEMKEIKYTDRFPNLGDRRRQNILLSIPFVLSKCNFK